jgi:hypothetical protein
MNPVFNFVTSLFGPATKLIDEIFTSPEEKAKYGNELAKIKNELAKIQNEISSKIIDYESQLITTKEKLVYGEISGNWLQRSWRPVLMLTFGFIIVYQYFIAHVIPGLDPIEFLPDRFWNLLELGIGGYVAGRSLEKMVPQITRAVTEAKEKAKIEKAVETGLMPESAKPQDDIDVTAREMRRMARKMRGEERRRKRAEGNNDEG